MKRFSLVAALMLGAASTVTFAQSPGDVPAIKCEPKPVLPGSALMQDKMVVKRFQGDIDNYKKCMNEYLEARKVAMKANEVAANKAIEDYNALMKSLNDQQKAQQ
ncbi:MAG: hypothetical protein ABIQ72_00130 [Usitatibacter sp.]